MRIVGWMGKIIFTTVLITVISLSISWFMINVYVDRLLSQMNIEGPVQELQFSDILDQASVEFNKMVTGSSPESANISNPPVQTTPAPEIKKDAVAAWNQDSASSGAELDSGEAAMETLGETMMSAEDFNRKKDLLSEADKSEIFTILIAKLPEAEMQHITQFVENGITTEEFDQAKEIISKYVDTEEYERLLQILAEY